MNEPNAGTTQVKPKFYPLPDGLYSMRILGAKKRTSKKGLQMATIVMAPIDSDYEGRKTFYNIILEDDYLQYSRAFFEVLGLENIEDIRNFDFFQLAGKKLRAIVKVERKNGFLSQKFVKFLPLRDCQTIVVIPEDLPPADVPLSDVMHFGRHGSLVFRAFRYRNSKDNKAAFDRSRKLIAVLNYFLKYLRENYGIGINDTKDNI